MINKKTGEKIIWFNWKRDYKIILFVLFLLSISWTYKYETAQCHEIVEDRYNYCNEYCETEYNPFQTNKTLEVNYFGEGKPGE